MRMETNNNIRKENLSQLALVIISLIMLGLIILSSVITIVNAVPSGPTILYNNTQNATPKPAAQIVTAGGSFTTMFLNATTQTPRWKAYVGNVTGRLVLEDASNKTIFDWRFASVTGKIYATRNNTIDWSSISCAARSRIDQEDVSLNMTVTNPDTINATFQNNVHRQFYIGTVPIANSTCPAIATYVNGTSQISSENASFQEILLQDSSTRLVYTTLINQNTTGYNNQKFDFQMIVPENEYQATPTTYYMYVELI